ncbi:MAG: UPF0158 family protein [Bacteroidia bacterium]
MQYERSISRDVADAMQENMMIHYLDCVKREVIFIPEDYVSWLDEMITDEEINEEENETDKMLLQDIKRINDEPDKFIEIPRTPTHEAFQIMEDFTEQLSDERLQNNLVRALNRPKPFHNFRFVLEEDNEVLQQWYKFRDAAYLEKAKEFLSENKIAI